MNYSVFINSKDCIEIRACDILSVKVAVDIGYQVIKLASQLEQSNKPIKLILDSSCVQSWSVDAFKMVQIIFKNIEFSKVATFGGNEKVKESHRKIISSAHKEEIARIFDERKDAEDWLFKD